MKERTINNIFFTILIGLITTLIVISSNEYVTKSHEKQVEHLLENSLNNTLYVNSSILSEINNRYMVEENEFIYCFKVKDYEDGKLLYDFTKPKIISASKSHVEHISCPYGSIHSHPGRTCLLSDQDMVSDSGIMGLICGENTFMFFNKNYRYNPYKIEVINNEVI